MEVAETVKEAQAFIDKVDESKSSFELAVSDKLQDSMGMNMAIILDKVLSKDFEPDGFKQRDGFRVYKYKKSELK